MTVAEMTVEEFKKEDIREIRQMFFSHISDSHKHS